MVPQKKLFYFGYGANSSNEMMSAITGNTSLVGMPIILDDYELCIQKFEQVPDTVSPNAPVHISPKKILQDAWGEKALTFETYTIRPKTGSKVKGTLWVLSPDERELVRNWELIDFGWYKDQDVEVVTSKGSIKAVTEILGDRQQIDRVVEGEKYEPFLNEINDFTRIATKARIEYRELIRSKEGSGIQTELKN